MTTSRRDFLRRTALASAAGLAAPLAAPSPVLGGSGPTPTHPAELQADRRGGGLPNLPTPHPGDPEAAARDEDYWREVAAHYLVSDRFTNLEAGYFGMMPATVLAAFHENIDRVNLSSSHFARTEYPALARAARQRVAHALGADTGEVAFARNATEALQTLIGQYNRLRSGDTVLYADLDYPAMQQAMNAAAARAGARVATLDIPEPASRDGILDAYDRAFAENPRTRLLLLTHVNNKTGLIHPVGDIVRMAESRGIDVIVDAAHSFGQVPLSLSDLGAAFAAVNLHKWVGAPVGIAAMYIRRDQLDAIDRAHGDQTPLDRIDGRIHTGTVNFATVLTVPDALDFQDRITVPAKSARLRYLRDAWVGPARDIPGVDILTPDDPELVGALTSFRLRGDGSPAGNREVARTLLEEFGIFTVARSGIARGDCVRVTPALYNTPADAERLVEALAVMAARG